MAAVAVEGGQDMLLSVATPRMDVKEVAEEAEVVEEPSLGRLLAKRRS